MQPHKRTQTYLRRLALCATLMTATLALAQTPPAEQPKVDPAKAPTAEKPAAAPTPKEQKVPTKAEVTAAGKADDDTSLAADGETLVLSPFEVTTEKDKGYRGGSTMSGTRMGADLDDIANPMTVVTKQQLLDFAARDINDIFASELSVEGTRTFTANSNDGKQDVDQVALNPETANRVRGLGSANISVGNFGKSNTIPIDVYNVDAVEISRGPNSSIFGMGEASGTVNLVPSAANVTRDHNKFSLSYSSYGTKRATLDINRMLWKNTLAFRINALGNNQEFLRKPSYDKTKRITISSTYRPFQYTSLRASFERFNEKYSRPNSATPREYMTLWNQVGRPSWNAFTNQWSYGAYTSPINGTSYSANSGFLNPTNGNDYYQYLNGTDTTTAYPVATNPRPAQNSLWLTGYQSTRVRPVMFVDQGQVLWAGTQNWQTNGTGAPAATNPPIRHEILQFALPLNYNIPAEYQFNANGVIPYTQIKATNNKSVYDYESLNLAGLNYGKKTADTWRVELEQFVVNTPTNVLAFQLGLFKERIEDYRRTFVGLGGDGVPSYIFPDVNTHLPDGSVNPRYGAPYISALAPQTYVNPIDTRTHRANIVYQLDLTKEKSFLRFLGRTKLLGYAEEFHKTHVPNNLRYQDQISTTYAPWLNNSIRNNNNAKFLVRYYMGDGVGGNVDYGSSAPPINNVISFRRYGSITTPVAETQGWYTVDNVPISPQYFAMAQQNVETTARGFILQNYVWKDRVITTWGRRKDTLRTRNSIGEPASSLDPTTGLTTSFSWMDNYNDWNVTNRQTNARRSQGYTDNQGIVVKPTKWLSLRYNQSTSFKPEDFAIDFQGNPLENSQGDSKDYGFTLNLFKGKLYINLTRYDTYALNSRDNTISVVGSRISNMDYDLNPTSNSTTFDLEDWLINEVTLRDAAGILAGTVTQQMVIDEAHRLMGISQERIDMNRTFPRAMTANRRAKGYELAIDYNPSAFLSFKINGSQQETIYSNIAPTWQDYRNERWALWHNITSPAGTIDPATGQVARWWNDSRYGTNTPLQNWLALNEAPMKVNMALQGKPVPQSAKYRANFLARYRLAGMFNNTPIIKDMTVGGKVSWIDKAAVGFYGAAPEADGYVREYDANRPIWYRAAIYVDAFATYDFRVFKNRIKGNVQLNARNLGESGRLQPFAVNPDGSKYNYRIIDPTEYILSLNFEL